MNIHNFRSGYNQKVNFNFGVSEMVRQVCESMLANRITKKIIAEPGCARKDVVLIGHSIHNDIAWLRRLRG